MNTTKLHDTQIAGLLLLTGTIIILVTIFFEFKVGWMGTQRPASEVPLFMRNNWSALFNIWSWQALGNLFLALSYLIFQKHSIGLKSLIWAILFISGVTIVGAFLITLGSYEIALSVYEETPSLFDSIRGAVRGLYFTSQLCGLFYIVIFIQEVFGKDGLVHKPVGYATLGFIFAFILIGISLGLAPKTSMISWFLFPIILGYSHLRKSNSIVE